MENLKHTKGEWKIFHQDDDIFIETDNSTAVICSIVGGSKLEQDEANAKLIASAPELLEALIKINGMCADAANIENGKLNIGKIAKITINAINKATK